MTTDWMRDKTLWLYGLDVVCQQSYRVLMEALCISSVKGFKKQLITVSLKYKMREQWKINWGNLCMDMKHGSLGAGCFTGNPQTTNWWKLWELNRLGSKQCFQFRGFFLSLSPNREISPAQYRQFCFLGTLFLRSYLLRHYSQLLSFFF